MKATVLMLLALAGLQFPEPQVVQRIAPAYPPLARAARIETSVRLSVRVTPDGRVEAVTLVSGHPLLNEAAIESVYRWRFERSISGGVVDVTVPFSLSTGLAITGKVVDPEGAPMVGVLVSAVVPVYQDGRRSWRPSANTAETDDRGVYRVYGLSPGEYFVRVTFRVPFDAPAPYDRYPSQTYYPGTPDYFVAVPVDVRSGPDAIADIQIPAVVTARVSGTVIAPSIQEVAAGSVSIWLVPTDPVLAGEPLALETGTLNEQSEFSFSFRGVRPGTYEIAVAVRSKPAAQGGTRLYSGRMPIEILDRNLENISVRLHGNVELNGRIVSPGVRTELLRLYLRGREGIELNANADIAPDGTFIITNVPEGKYSLIVSGSPPDTYLSDVRLGSQSIYSNPIINVTDRRTEDLRLLIVRGGGTIEGQVQNSRQQGVSTQVMLVPEPPRRQNVMLYKSVRSDGNGVFRFSALAPGDYKLFAWEVVPPAGAVENAEFIARYEQRGTRVTVRDGAMLSGSIVQEIPKP
jgi:TonB family protein